MKIITDYFMSNDIVMIKRLIPTLAAYANKIKVEEVRYKYYVALAALDPEKLIELCEQNTLTDNYWRTYWSYIAYYKVGEGEKAENALTDLSRYTQSPEDNIMLLHVVGMLNTCGEDVARIILDNVKDMYSKELSLFAKALYLRLYPVAGKLMGANKKNTAFYMKNIILFGSLEELSEYEVEDEEEDAEAEATAAEGNGGENPCKYDFVGTFSEGLALVMTKDFKHGFIDKKGREVIPCDFDDARKFHEGMASVEKSRKRGYIDKTGRIVVPCIYDDAYDFKEGLAAVRKGDKYGYIDKTGKEVIPLEFESGFDFSDGMAIVKKDNLCGYIDKKGKLVIPYLYHLAFDFEDGRAIVLNDSGLGYIDKAGRELTPFIYDDFDDLINTYK